MELICPLCNATEVKFLFRKDDIPYHKCRVCGFEFSVTERNANLENSITDFETPYLQYFGNKAADAKNHESLLKWICKEAGRTPSKFLDIGCGSGKWVDFLESKEFTAFGIEPSVALYDNFLKRNPSFFNGTIHNYLQQYPEQKFDVITAFDVLEHIKDPVNFLKSVALLMNPGSLLFVSLPDNNSLHRKVAAKRWHYFNKYHYSYFNKKTLSLSADKAGLKLKSYSHRSRYFQPRYVWDYFINFVLGRKTKYKPANKGLVIPINLFDNMYCVLEKINA